MPLIRLGYRPRLALANRQKRWINAIGKGGAMQADRRRGTPATILYMRLYMNSVTQTAQCSLVERLAQRGMDVDGACHVFKHCAHFQCMGELSGQFRHMTSHSVNAEHAMIVLAGDDANKAAIVAPFH